MVNQIAERNKAIGEIIVEEFDAPVQVLTANEDENGVIYGNLLSSGDFYTYAFDDENIGVLHHEEETAELNEYAQGLLAGYGIKTDSDFPVEYTFGMLNLDAQVRCTKGGTPCGKICLPKGSVCRKHGGGSGGTGKLKSGSGLALAGGVAGGVALAAGATAAGGLAYANRKNLARGGKAVAERLKRAGTEGRDELKTGLSGAKMSLKAGFETAKELTVAGAENASRAIGRNLKAAGEDIKTTAKNSAKTTTRKARNISETFFGKKTTNQSEATPINPPNPQKQAPKPRQVTVTPVPPPSLPPAKTSSKPKRGRPPKK
jgi:hypothetical protein